MSYILDALRRADSERERSDAPGLHAQHASTAPTDDAQPREPVRVRWLVGGGLLLLAAALAGYYGLREPAAPAPTPVPMPVTPMAAPSAMPQPAPAVAPLPTPMPRPPAPPAPPPPPALTSLPPMPAAAPPAPPVAAPKPVVAAAPASTGPASAAAPQPRIPTLAELPDELRREIPALVVGGAMYSPTPANRMLILNGQVSHEGDQPAPGLVLEQINLKTATLRWKGQRFRIVY